MSQHFLPKEKKYLDTWMVSMDYLLFRGYHLTNLATGIGFFLKIAPKSTLRKP